MLFGIAFLGILSGNVFAEALAAQGVQREAQTGITMSIAEAAQLGLIHGYCYIWDGMQYLPIQRTATSRNIIPGFYGFWTIVYQDVDLLMPMINTGPSHQKTMSFTLKNNTWRFISLPVDPGNYGVEANIGDDLGPGLAENQWRVSKWLYDQKRYINYDGINPFPEMTMGSGFWVHQKTGSDKTINVTGMTVVPPDGYFAVKLPAAAPGKTTFHMVGNPYWYGLIWANCKVRTPMTSSLSLAKRAVDIEDIKSWYVGLAVETLDGSAIDSYNRAGIVESTGPEYQEFCAFDMVPPGNYVNLALKDPSENSTLYAYDYRASGADKYVWNVVLRTSFDKADVRLSLDNLDTVPDNYQFTLTDPTGKSISLSEGIILSLSKSADTMLTLTAVKTESTGIKENNLPSVFGITNVHPNPFNPATTIDYSMPASGMAKVQVYNLNGQLVATIADGFKNAGRHSAVWNAGQNASGIYIVQIISSNKRDMRKITLVK
jgi:hypothetical protein